MKTRILAQQSCCHPCGILSAQDAIAFARDRDRDRSANSRRSTRVMRRWISVMISERNNVFSKTGLELPLLAKLKGPQKLRTSCNQVPFVSRKQSIFHGNIDKTPARFCS